MTSMRAGRRKATQSRVPVTLVNLRLVVVVLAVVVVVANTNIDLWPRSKRATLGLPV